MIKLDWYCIEILAQECPTPLAAPSLVSGLPFLRLRYSTVHCTVQNCRACAVQYKPVLMSEHTPNCLPASPSPPTPGRKTLRKAVVAASVCYRAAKCSRLIRTATCHAVKYLHRLPSRSLLLPLPTFAPIKPLLARRHAYPTSHPLTSYPSLPSQSTCLPRYTSPGPNPRLASPHPPHTRRGLTSTCSI